VGANHALSPSHKGGDEGCAPSPAHDVSARPEMKVLNLQQAASRGRRQHTAQELDRERGLLNSNIKDTHTHRRRATLCPVAVRHTPSHLLRPRPLRRLFCGSFSSSSRRRRRPPAPPHWQFPVHLGGHLPPLRSSPPDPWRRRSPSPWLRALGFTGGKGEDPLRPAPARPAKHHARSAPTGILRVASTARPKRPPQRPLQHVTSLACFPPYTSKFDSVRPNNFVLQTTNSGDLQKSRKST